MDFERQKPVTDEYRENYERVFGVPHDWPRDSNGNWIGHGSLPHGSGIVSGGLYKSGCPILSEEQGK